MPSYSAPVDDVLFILNDVLKFGNYNNLAGFAEATPDLVEAILKEGAKFSEEVIQPLNQVGDKEGCTRHDDGSVTTPTGFKDAYNKFSEGGWGGLSAPQEYGGQDLPSTLSTVIGEFNVSSNVAFTMYPGLTHSAVLALETHGSEEQKNKYLPNLISGKWSATMNLTEPHCGTDLGQLKSSAKSNGDGSYSIKGTKIFISAGEHDLTENIIHLVLARVEGAPEGSKGISLFVVPKFIVNEDGSLGEKNKVSCGSIEEKMGIHGNSTCELVYEGATGWMVGEENRGLKAMFTMMNEARIGVSIQGLALAEVAYQNAVAYARERLQGRALTGAKEADKPADPIIVHPDVRRTLLTIRSFTEAARGLLLWASLNGDIAKRSESEAERKEAENFLALITPVLKGFFTDMGFECAVNAQQMFGGHGYIWEVGMEQFVRDSRVFKIYEGANGVQALDLVGRKLVMDNGQMLKSFVNNAHSLIKSCSRDKNLADYIAPMKKSLGHLEESSKWLIKNSKPSILGAMKNKFENADQVGAGATDYLHMFGIVALGVMWLKIGKAVSEKLASGEKVENEAFLKAKLVYGKFFMERYTPMTSVHKRRIAAGAGTMMSLSEEEF